MIRKQKLMVFFILLMIPNLARAQQWSGIIAPSRAIDWSNAGTGIPGGIPNRTTICATLNPGATANQINSAIASCPAGQVVFLNAGTYNLTSGINFTSNVTLRGAGSTQTILVFSGGTGCGGPTADVCFQGSNNWNGAPQHLTTWTGGYAAGTTQITLGSTSGLSVGQVLILDQANDLLDTGQVFVCDNNVSDPLHTGCATDTPAAGRNVGGVDYNQQQYVQVTAINGNVVNISPGLYMPNWRASQNPGAWWATALVRMSGIEDMTLDHTNSNETPGTMFFNAYQCWVKNIKSLNSNRNHVWLQYSARVVIRDSYFYGTKNAATLSYGIEPWQTGDLLLENNIFQHIVAPLLMGNSEGTVFSYNFGIDDHYSVATWMMPTIWTHDAAGDMNLFEGNEGSGFIQDEIHGSHNFATVFRNQFTGLEPGKNQQTVPVILQAHTRYVNMIGNVLGTAGYHNTYQNLEPTATSCSTGIYNLGFGGSACGGSIVPFDALVLTTLMRWGNYDTVHAGTQWNASEVPSGLIQFANPVPSTQSLPASFYLSSKPSWWGTMPWPAIGPDVTGGTDTTGRVYLNPAHTCFNTTPTDSNGILLFNANTCYGSLTPPNPPTNLGAVAN
jgi:hypothetical protein